MPQPVRAVTPGLLREILEPLLLALATAAASMALAEVLYPLIEGWLLDAPASLGWLDEFWLREPGRLGSWLGSTSIGLLAGISLVMGWGRGRAARAIGGVFALLCAIAALYLVAQRPEWIASGGGGGRIVKRAPIPWVPLSVLAAGMIAGVYVMLRLAVGSCQPWSKRSIVLIGVGLGALLIGWSTITDAIEEHKSQRLPPFRAKLVAVTAAPAQPTPGMRVVTTGQGMERRRPIHYLGRTYYVAPFPPPLHFSHQDVARVRWVLFRDYTGKRNGVSIRFADRLGDHLRKRSLLLLQHRWQDAVYVDGKLIVVAQYASPIYGERLVMLDDPATGDHGARRLYLALTGLQR